MKLIDLFEAKIDLTPIKIKNADFSKVGPVLGNPETQVQGHARINTKTANTVIKIANIPNINDDEYVEFVKVVIANQNNPFFPKLYNAKVYETYKDVDKEISPEMMAGAKYKLVLHMEKLHSLSGEKTFDAALSTLEQLGFDVANYNTGQSDSRILDQILDRSFDEPSDRKALANKTKNPALKKALLLLEPFFVKFGNDMHSGNAMFRLTGTGPQLVIIDPFLPFKMGQGSD